MEIVLNEYEWAENAIEARNLGRKPSETLSRIARYYYQKDGYKKREIRVKLADFILQCNPDAVLVKWEGLIERVTKTANKVPLARIDSIPVTTAEIEAVKAAGGRQLQRLAFALLCIAKYWNLIRPANNNWANTRDRDIMSMANVNTSMARFNDMMRTLMEHGMIRFSRRVDNLNSQVLYIDDTADTVINISDFRSLGNQYLMYLGEPFFRCERCGLVVKRKGPAHKYCSDCAAEMYVRRSVESVMRKRSDDRAFEVKNQFV